MRFTGESEYGEHPDTTSRKWVIGLGMVAALMLIVFVLASAR